MSLFEDLIESTRSDCTRVMNNMGEILDRLNNMRHHLDYLYWANVPISDRGIDEDKKPEISIHTLGRFYIETAGRSLSGWPSRRVESLFQLMLIHNGTRLEHDYIIEACGFSANGKNGLNSLRVTIHELRKALEVFGLADSDQPFFNISSESGAYRLTLHQSVWVDYLEFELGCSNLIENGSDTGISGSATRVIGLYKGDLFEENRYDDWTNIPRERILDTYLNVLWVLAKRFSERHETQRSIELCKRILEKDILDEGAYELIISSYVEIGRFSAALRWLAICRETLSKELGIQPNSAIRGLEANINNSANIEKAG